MVESPAQAHGRIDPHRAGIWLLGGLLVLSAIRGYRTTFTEHGNDLTIFLRAAQAALRGESPYTDPTYLYLPVFSVMLRPLAMLPLWMAAALWQVASWGAVLWSVHIAARLVDPDRFQPWLNWAALALVYRLADSGLAYGQANAFTLLLMLKAVELGSHHRWTLAALLVGVAAALKILPGVLLAVFLLGGRWRPALVGAAAALSLALLLPWSALGADLALQVHREWFTEILSPYLHGGDALLHRMRFVPGQSLVAYGYHSLGDLPVSANDPDLRANFADLPPTVIHWIVRAVTLTHVAVFVAVALWARRPWTSRRFLEISALAMCTVLLCAPIVHRAHFLWILPAFTLLLSLAKDPDRSIQRTVARTVIVVSGSSIGLTSSGIVGREFARWLTGHNVVTIGGEVTWIALVIICGSPMRRASDRAPVR